MFVFKYENDSYGIPYLIATRFSPAGVNPFPVLAGLLTRSQSSRIPSITPVADAATLRGLTAAGTVPDSHLDSLFIRGGEPPEPISNYKNTNIFYNNIIYTKKNPQPAGIIPHYTFRKRFHGKDSHRPGTGDHLCPEGRVYHNPVFG